MSFHFAHPEVRFSTSDSASSLLRFCPNLGSPAREQMPHLSDLSHKMRQPSIDFYFKFRRAQRGRHEHCLDSYEDPCNAGHFGWYADALLVLKANKLRGQSCQDLCSRPLHILMFGHVLHIGERAAHPRALCCFQKHAQYHLGQSFASTCSHLHPNVSDGRPPNHCHAQKQTHSLANPIKILPRSYMFWLLLMNCKLGKVSFPATYPRIFYEAQRTQRLSKKLHMYPLQSLRTSSAHQNWTRSCTLSSSSPLRVVKLPDCR